MDDNIPIALFIFGFIGAIALIIRAVNKSAAKRKYEYEQRVKEQDEETRKWRAKMHARMKTESAIASSVPPRGKEMTKTYTPSYAPSPTQSVQASRPDDGIDMITNMMVMNAIMQHHQPSASTSNEIVAISSSPSSYDSGPSYCDDSPSSSWSSSRSDSSSSWSSSSDSGPSSDW